MGRAKLFVLALLQVLAEVSVESGIELGEILGCKRFISLKCETVEFFDFLRGIIARFLVPVQTLRFVDPHLSY